MLLSDSNTGGTTLRKVRLRGTGEVVWTGRIDNFTASTMTFDPRSRRWRVAGWDRERGMVRAEGVVGETAMDVTRWPAPPTSEAWINAFTATGPEALVVETRYDGGPFQRLLPPRWSWVTMLIQPSNQESRYWTLGPSGRRHLGTSRFGSDCHAGVLANDALLCHVFDGTRTRFVSLATTGAISGLGWIDGRFASDRSVVAGWITGWADSTPVAIRLGTAQALRLTVQEHSVGHLAVAGDRLAAVTFGPDGISVRTYAVDRVPGREAKR